MAVIETRGIEKAFGAVAALRGVTLSIDSGEIIGLLGPNGAGKTTLIRILTCYHYPTAGLAMIDGMDVTEDPLRIKRRIGYLPENAPVYHDMKVLEYLRFVSRARAIPADQRAHRIEVVCEQCSLGEVLFRPIHKLSKGFRQRVGLAQAMLHDPQILILDEPTNGLDPNQIIEIRSLIKTLGTQKTVILSTHVMQEVEALCNRVLIINEGALVAQGTTAEISRHLKGEQMLDITIRVDNECAPRALRDSLLQIAGVDNVHAVEKVSARRANGIIYTAELGMDAGGDDYPGGLIFAWAVEQGHELLSLAPSKLKLEDIFVRLTT